MNGGSGARALFRDVLVASASVPGLFPPVVIRVQEQQTLFEEVHVDGTTTVPFLVPLAFVEPSPDVSDRLHGVTVYIIADVRSSEQSASIRLRTRSIQSRSVSAGAQLQFAAIPVTYPQRDPFDFRTSTMRSLFQYGYTCAQAGRLWISTRGVGSDEASRTGTVAGQNTPCPVDDESIGRFAVR
jgi:hypothetical protein